MKKTANILRALRIEGGYGLPFFCFELKIEQPIFSKIE